jgi:serine/threonine protein kinase
MAPTPILADAVTVPPAPGGNAVPAALQAGLDSKQLHSAATVDVPSGQAATPRQPVGAVEVATVPGYEIEKVLGRGGMGVVYLARHVALKRPVALKMILAGGHASADEVKRFISEAEAVAAIQHPNIVQVYEVGKHDGLPYMALEFVAGGSLAQTLKERPPTPREAARLVEQLARGMNAAHQVGIVHRDLKPGNVLLQSKFIKESAQDTEKNQKISSGSALSVSSMVNGIPKITDFGLAKRVEGGSDLTQTGAILGTPSYMAPEQAAGEGKRVGPAADVYALGAILYECLTGRPPFLAPTPLETLIQLAMNEPTPPSRLKPKIPADLDTICLKCLHKQPGQRYASAEALAEDLRRWQADEPIGARPVSRAERLIKWVRRNPLPTALAGVVMVAVAVVAGIILSYNARLQDEIVLKEKEAKDANEARAAAKKEAKAAEEARQKIEATLVESLLSRIGQTESPVDRVEKVALWELAEPPTDNIRFGFLKTGLATQAKAACLQRRAAMVALALAGLNSRRRQEFLDIITERFRAADVTKEIRQACALIAMHLGTHDTALLGEAGEVCHTQLTTYLPLEYKFIVNDAAILAHYLPARDGTLFLETIGTKAPNHPQHLKSLLRGWWGPLNKLAPAEGAQLLVSQMAKTTHFVQLREFAQFLTALADKLEPKQRQQLLVQASELLVAQLKKRDVVSYDAKVQALSSGLLVLTDKIHSAQGKKFLAEAAHLLLAQINHISDTNGGDPARHAETFVLLASKLEPQQGTDMLFAALAKGKYGDTLKILAEGVALLAAKLEPQPRQKIARQAAEVLLNHLRTVLGDKLDKYKFQRMDELPNGLAALLDVLETQERWKIAEDASNLLATGVAKQTHDLARTLFLNGWAALADKLNSQKAVEEIVRQLYLPANFHPDTGGPQNSLALALARAAGKLEPKQGANLLLEHMSKNVNPFARTEMAIGVAAIAPRLEAETRYKISAAAAKILVNQMGADKSTRQTVLVKGLEALAASFVPEFGAELMLAEMARTKDPLVLGSLGQALATLASRLEREKAQKTAEQGFRVLAGTVTKVKKNDLLLSGLATGMVALAGKVEPRQGQKFGEQIAELLILHLPQSYSDYEEAKHAKNLADIAGILDKKHLVRILKNPICTELAQLTILRELDRRTGQRFGALWEFVAWAEQHEPGLDLAAPFQRAPAFEESGFLN